MTFDNVWFDSSQREFNDRYLYEIISVVIEMKYSKKN